MYNFIVILSAACTGEAGMLSRSRYDGGCGTNSDVACFLLSCALFCCVRRAAIKAEARRGGIMRRRLGGTTRINVSLNSDRRRTVNWTTGYCLTVQLALHSTSTSNTGGRDHTC